MVQSDWQQISDCLCELQDAYDKMNCEKNKWAAADDIRYLMPTLSNFVSALGVTHAKAKDVLARWQHEMPDCFPQLDIPVGMAT